MVSITNSLPKYSLNMFKNIFKKVKTIYELAINIETLYLFDSDDKNVIVYEMDRTILFAYFNKDCRYVPFIDHSKKVSILLGTLFFGMFGYIFGYFIGNIVTSVLFSVLFGAVGLPLGYLFISPLIAKKPIWIVSRSNGQLAGIVHSRLGNTDISNKTITPEILHNLMLAKDETEIFSAGLSNYQKLAIGTLVILAISCLVALFLFVGAFGTGG